MEESDRMIQWTPAWLVVYAQPRKEELARANLEEQGYEAFLPLYREREGAEPRPLFTRYLFAEAAGKPWAPIRGTLGVSRLVANADGEMGIVPVAVIDNLKRQHEGGIVIARPRRAVLAGEVSLTEGSMAGLGGLVSGGNQDRTEFLLDMLGRSVQVSAPSDILERVR